MRLPLKEIFLTVLIFSAGGLVISFTKQYKSSSVFIRPLARKNEDSSIILLSSQNHCPVQLKKGLDHFLVNIRQDMTVPGSRNDLADVAAKAK